MPKANDEDSVTFEERYEQALRIAAVVHAEDVRKGTRIPYITHVVHVSRLLQEYGASEAIVLAGLLHDVLEDADDNAVTRERLAAVFPGFEAAPGPDSLLEALVGLIDRHVGKDARRHAQAVSEQKVEGGDPRPWKTRKLEQLAHLGSADEQVALLKGADTLHNITAIADDVETAGASVLTRFNASPDDLLWYYGSVVAVVVSRLTPQHALSAALDMRLQRLRLAIDAATGARDR